MSDDVSVQPRIPPISNTAKLHIRTKRAMPTPLYRAVNQPYHTSNILKSTAVVKDSTPAYL